MSEARKTLDFDALNDFDVPAPKPRPSRPTPAAKKAVDVVTSFPSRDPSQDGQLNIKAPVDVLRRFQAMAKADRYTYGEFLELLLNAYTKK